MFGKTGGRYSPPRNTGGGWSRENTNPLLRESRGRTRHTLGRENEVPRIVQRRDEYDRERERGHYRPSGEDIESPGGRNPSIPGYRVVGTGLGVHPEETPKILACMQEGRLNKYLRGLATGEKPGWAQ